MCIFEYIFDYCSCSLKIIYVTICLFSILYPILKKKLLTMLEKILSKGNLRIFVSLNLHIRLFIYVRRHDCVINMADLLEIFLLYFNKLEGLNNKKVL